MGLDLGPMRLKENHMEALFFGKSVMLAVLVALVLDALIGDPNLMACTGKGRGQIIWLLIPWGRMAGKSDWFC